MSLGQTACFDLALASAALLGVVGGAASPPINFLPVLWCGWNLPIGFFLFYKVYSKHLGLLEKP